MNSNAIIITADTFKSLPKNVQEAVLEAAFGGKISPTTARNAELLDEEDDSFAQLSPAQAREFYNGCGEKTRRALEVIAQSESRQFHLADVAKAIGVQPDELRGVWGGLTRRLYTVTGQNDGYLINWERHDPVNDDEGNYIDHIGEVSELTYQSFRKLLIK
jgi:hypothetical protein